MSEHEPCAQLTLESPSADVTQDIGARLGAVLRAGDVVALYGELGAGKTRFVQRLGLGLGVGGHVTSPTFILVRQHPGDPALCHADAYRLTCGAELEDLGLEDMLEVSVLAIEWAERVAEVLPGDRLEVHISALPDESRRLTFRALGPRTAALLQEAFA